MYATALKKKVVCGYKPSKPFRNVSTTLYIANSIYFDLYRPNINETHEMFVSHNFFYFTKDIQC